MAKEKKKKEEKILVQEQETFVNHQFSAVLINRRTNVRYENMIITQIFFDWIMDSFRNKANSTEDNTVIEFIMPADTVFNDLLDSTNRYNLEITIFKSDGSISETVKLRNLKLYGIRGGLSSDIQKLDYKGKFRAGLIKC